MTAPEKIWAWDESGEKCLALGKKEGEWTTEDCADMGVATEYTRSDLIPTAAYVAGLEAAATAGRELAGYASYSEIVGAIGNNRKQIREWCDKVFAAGCVIDDALSARPDAPDVRVVTVAQLCAAVFSFTDELRNDGTQLTRTAYGLLVEMKKAAQAMIGEPKE